MAKIVSMTVFYVPFPLPSLLTVKWGLLQAHIEQVLGMPITFLERDHRTGFSPPSNAWLVACLCAAWCDVCTRYRTGFERLSQLHPEAHFVWIDVEDCAELVGDFDIENFPTLLIQHGDTVCFYGPVLPDTHIAGRLLKSLMGKSESALRAEAQGSEERIRWQQECNLYRRLKEGCPS